MSINLDYRLVDFLQKRGITDNLQEFLQPSLKNLLNPLDLNGMFDAVEKIRKAISLNKRILVFGDYDCDGISATYILVKYLRSKSANVDAFIPSRFEDGYGLSSSTIAEICSLHKPDLLITVDLGVTAIDEVEQLKSLGIDVIVTDHHEPIDRLPACTLIDAKVPGQKYAFDGLCGAGVALKIVEALEGKKFVERYLDVCAIATIGDIVPLISENRIIAKLGLEKINKGEACASIKFLMNKLGLISLTSEDVSFRIVPRLNASGRMDNGKKVLDFLLEEDADKLEDLYAKLEQDNNHRLEEIANGTEKIDQQLLNIDLSEDASILVCGEFHQGVLGILASRVCHDYNRPAIIFTKTEEGTLKGSGRSTSYINVHSILCELSDLFVRFGGHKMAVGLEILPQNFDKFKKLFNQKIKEQCNPSCFLLEKTYDIEITEDDISLKFINNLKQLEPFGCGNEKPVFVLKTYNLIAEQMKGKNYKHYRLHTKNGKQIVAFNAYKHIELLKNNCSKNLFVELEINEFNGKRYAGCKLKDVVFTDTTFSFNQKIVNASSILNKYLSFTNKNSNLICNHLSEIKLIEQAEKLAKSKFGTAIICQSQKQLERLLASEIIKNNYIVSDTFAENKQNCIIIKSSGVQNPQIGYTNYLFLRSAIKNEHYLFDKTKFVYDQTLFNQPCLVVTDRKVMAICYNLIIANYQNIYANDIFEFAEKLSYLEKSLSVSQIMFAMLVFWDLGFITISGICDTTITVNPQKKAELTESKFYREFTKN